MATSTATGTAHKIWYYSGSSFDGASGRAKEIVQTSYPSVYESAHEVKVSYNTPNLWRKVVELVPYYPRLNKNGKYPEEPRQPVFREPRPPAPRPRGPLQSAKSWSRLSSRYQKKLKAWEALVIKHKAAFDLRYKKYLVRLAKYQAYENKVLNGRPKTMRRRIRNAEDEWHPFSLDRTFYTGTHGSLTTNWRQWVYGEPVEGAIRYGGDITSVGDLRAEGLSMAELNTLISNVTTAADSTALNRFYNNLTGEQVHLGSVLAERAQTIGLLADAVTRLSQFLLTFSRKNVIRSVSKLLTFKGSRKVADDILAFKFGVQPLIGDVQGAAEAVAHFNVDKINLFKVQAKGSANKEESITVTIVKNGKQYVITHSVRVNVRYVCEYGTDNTLTREMSRLGLINPIEPLWELAPWSFVVDWVLPIGDWIRHLFADTGLVFRRGTKSIRCLATTTIKVVHYSEEPYTPQYWGYESWVDDLRTAVVGRYSKTRVLLDTAPHVPIPRFKNPISLTHLFESLALLRQKIRS